MRAQEPPHRSDAHPDVGTPTKNQRASAPMYSCTALSDEAVKGSRHQSWRQAEIPSRRHRVGAGRAIVNIWRFPILSRQSLVITPVMRCGIGMTWHQPPHGAKYSVSSYSYDVAPTHLGSARKTAMTWIKRTAALAPLFLLAFQPIPAADPHEQPFEPAAIEFFEKKIRPILANNCYTCHSANTNARGGLRVDDRNGLIVGGNTGSAITPGKPDESLLLQAVTGTHPRVKMPPEGQLAAAEIADLRRWIEAGAAWPPVEIPDDIHDRYTDYDQLRAEHWAWQPLKAAAVPEVFNRNWPRGPVDRFLLAALEAKHLQPVADADKLTLIRRATFDLTGLPPSPAEIDAFLADKSANAFEKLVDRLLASSAFGEHWGRHWLDVARYGESTGSSRNVPYPHAWRYRDYVVAAFNNDKPYNDFVCEQIAGDLLGGSTPAERDERRIATGFLALGVKDVNQRFKVRFVMDNIDEQIDTVARSFLALTAGCARCHDHKYDPIPTADYYALAGIFHSTDHCAGVRNKMGGGGLDYYDTQMLVLLEADISQTPGYDAAAKEKQLNQLKHDLAKAKTELESLQQDTTDQAEQTRQQLAAARRKANRLQQELNLLTDPLAERSIALGVRDAPAPADTEIRIRGEAEKLGPTVPRGFLSIVTVPDCPPVNPQQSGRLELAAWLASGQNPLTPRVFVNRVWHHLFGQGLVRTVDNFGVMGDLPSHPELLDHLALQFVHDGWSLKRLVRTLVLTRAYQLDSTSTPENVSADPANRLVWRHNPRRLTAEEIRDAMLAASGSLQLHPAETSPAAELKVMEIPNNGADAQRLSTHAAQSVHRSVYLPLVRGLTPTSLLTFDFAEQGMVTGSREVTTVAPQALYLLNDPLVRREAQRLASRVFHSPAPDEKTQIALAYRLALGRVPTTVETARVQAYLAEYQAALDQDAVALAVELSANKPAENSANEGGEAGSPVALAGQESPTDNAGERALDQGAPDSAEVAKPPSDPRRAAWVSFCQALLASAEFRYLK